jgi:hypothetical protein
LRSNRGDVEGILVGYPSNRIAKRDRRVVKKSGDAIRQGYARSEARFRFEAVGGNNRLVDKVNRSTTVD